MRLLYRLVAMGLALMAAVPAASAQQPLPDAFDGRFRGMLSDRSGEISGEFTVAIKKSGSGFTVTWPPRIALELEPGGRPGVFMTGEEAQVLQGSPVYWARIENHTLTVYSAQIDEHGGYHVDNFVYTPSGTDLDLVIRHVKTGAEPRISRGRLVRYGD